MQVINSQEKLNTDEALVKSPKMSSTVLNNNQQNMSKSSSGRASLKMSQQQKKVIKQMGNQEGAQNYAEIIFKHTNNLQIQPVPPPQTNQLCHICQYEFKINDMISLSNCPHLFCFKCLKNYSIYKLTNFDEVFCPQQMCTKKLQKNSFVYNSLDQKMKNRFQKINQFFLLKNDKVRRPCPNYECLGIINNYNQPTCKCSKCNKIYCTKCWGDQHKKSCDDMIVKKFEINLGFKQCIKCKMIVERNGGCQHMKCRCNYQFCYLCGQEWKSGHTCPPPQIPDGLSLIEQLNWMLINRGDGVQFFHFSPFKYISWVTSLSQQGSFQSFKAILYLLFIYPITVVIGIFHIFYILVGIHILFILLFIILNPCWIIQLFHQYRIMNKIQSKCLKVSLVLIMILLYPLTFVITVVYSFGYFWLFNCSPRGGLVTIVRRQVKGNLTVMLAPWLASKRSSLN